MVTTMTMRLKKPANESAGMLTPAVFSSFSRSFTLSLLKKSRPTFSKIVSLLMSFHLYEILGPRAFDEAEEQELYDRDKEEHYNQYAGGEAELPAAYGREYHCREDYAQGRHDYAEHHVEHHHGGELLAVLLEGYHLLLGYLVEHALERAADVRAARDRVRYLHEHAREILRRVVLDDLAYRLRERHPEDHLVHYLGELPAHRPIAAGRADERVEERHP